MSILGKYTDNLIEKDTKQKSHYELPKVANFNDEDFPLKKSFMISTIFHVAAVGSVWVLSIIFMLLGIKFTLFDKPIAKTQDIEFVLVDHEDTPINKKTPYRADINSRAGGHHDPTRKVSMPSPAPGPKTPAPAAPKSVAKTVQKQNPIQKMVQQTVPSKAPAKTAQSSTPGPKKPEMAKPQPPTARPSMRPTMAPKTVKTPTSPFAVPVPKGGTSAGKYATGPISGSGKSAIGGGYGGYSSSGKGIGPSLAPTGTKGSGAGASGTKLASGGGGTGSGNPGPGNPNGRPGIDAIREPDFGPYMRELQRRIKMNWDPPKGNESKRVVLLFKIAKDGRLLSCSVFKSSGLPSADKAALQAVQLTAPFRPLPAEYKRQSIDIQFTFDYNVFGASGYN